MLKIENSRAGTGRGINVLLGTIELLLWWGTNVNNISIASSHILFHFIGYTAWKSWKCLNDKQYLGYTALYYWKAIYGKYSLTQLINTQYMVYTAWQHWTTNIIWDIEFVKLNNMPSMSFPHSLFGNVLCIAQIPWVIRKWIVLPTEQWLIREISLSHSNNYDFLTTIFRGWIDKS